MNIVFFGTPSFAVPFLEELIREGLVPCAVFSQPDRPQGRKGELIPTPVKQCALAYDIEVFQPENINTPDTTAQLAALEPDYIVVVAFGQLIKQDILDIPRLGCVNVHPSLLPRHRGASPLQYTLLEGDTKSAVSIMLMDAKMDHGPLLLQERFTVKPDETYDSLQAKAQKIGAPLLVHALRDHAAGSITPQEQAHERATFTKLLTRDSGKINITTMDAVQVDRMLRAFSPWPGAWLDWQGVRVKLLEGAVSPNAPKGSSEDVFVLSEGRLFLACADDSFFEISRLQPEGKRGMSAADFIRGYLS